ncbi:hypothetical protein LCGC14_1471230 [marine sediment metagenome]|uniref:Gingipain domain-containing protein n=1 Tax=marine sediment metagenome TaxID=412755 RepID=A0A0F9JCZ0_9ZZZZ
MRLLIISPLHDYPTTLSNKAVRILLKFIDAHKIKYDFLTSFTANRFNINRKARKNKYDGVFYYGHGQEDRLGDWAMEILPLIDKRNIGLFQDSIFYTMSCLSGKELAPIAIKEGVRAYFGHNVRYFAFVNQLKIDYDFFYDWVKLVNYIPKRLILGDTTGAALRKYELFANSIYAKYLFHDKEGNLKLLYSNALHLELFGDTIATLPKF